MKKLALILAIVILVVFASAFAEGMDFASMSDEQLQMIIDGAQTELANRKGDSVNDGILIDQDGVKVYLTGNHEIWGNESLYLDLEVVVENNSDKTISILIDSMSVNGWNVYGFGVSDTQPGKKQKGNLEFCLSEAGISTYEEVEEIEFIFTIYDSENWETIKTLDPVLLTF